jgi:chromosomal replication initiator protein
MRPQVGLAPRIGWETGRNTHARGGVAWVRVPDGGEPNGAQDVAHMKQDGPGEAWPRIQSRLRAELGEDVFVSWFGRVEVDQLSDGVLHLSVATRFLQKWLRSHYYEQVLGVCRSEYSDAIARIEFRVRQPQLCAIDQVDAAAAVRAARPALAPMSRPDTPPALPLRTACGGLDGSPLDPRYTFDSFVMGGSNRLAHAAAQEVAASPLGVQGFNPLFLHSTVGMGKTHLLHAIAWRIKQTRADARVLYLTAERFMTGFVAALKARDAIAFKDQLRQIDVLLIDDMEFLQGPTIQQEFCHTLNSLIDGGRQVLIAADRPPMQLDKLDSRMRSRLGGGLVAEIGAMDYELRRKILAQRADEAMNERATLAIPGVVLDYLAERLTEGGRELEGAVNRLRAVHQLTGQSITLETAEHIVRDLMRGIEPKRVRIDDILRTVSKHYGVNRNDLLGVRRNRSIVRPRQVGMYLAKILTQRSLPEIGRRFGNRDHTTVLHAIRKIEQLMQGDPSLREEVELLKKLLND